MVDYVFSGPDQTVYSGGTVTGLLTDNGAGPDVNFTFSVNAGTGSLETLFTPVFSPTTTTVALGLHGTIPNTSTTTYGTTAVSAMATLSLTGGYYFSGFSLSGTGGGFNVVAVTTGGNSISLTTPGQQVLANVNKVKFSMVPRGVLSVQGIWTNGIQCFAPGTQIATPTGDVAVEQLTAGDALLTKDGRITHVKWRGETVVNRDLLHPHAVNPVTLHAGALGNGLPLRDLLVSPDHALEIDGYLVNAGALVNGTSITQSTERLPEGFTYHHLDTGAHELLLAEGVAAESFIDYAGRDGFENSAETDDLTIAEIPLPRISSARTLPMLIKDRIHPKTAA